MTDEQNSKDYPWYRIIDETGEDYLYPPEFFVDPNEEAYVDKDVCEYVRSLLIER